ncbi:MAG: hypothetical protein AAB862_02175, partial [Patescibacteria group bacterium]
LRPWLNMPAVLQENVLPARLTGIERQEAAIDGSTALFTAWPCLKYPEAAMIKPEHISREKYQKANQSLKRLSVCDGKWSISSG